MADKLRIGILGCGVITQRTLPGLLALLRKYDGAVGGLCDISDANIDTVAEGVGIPGVRRFESVEAMSSNESIDTILVATPIAHHYENVKSALENGCHVYTHKTLAGSAEKCEELATIARKNDVALACSPGQLSLPAYRKAKEIIDSGELGTIVSVDAAAEATAHRYESERANESPSDNTPFSWEWYHNEARGGGPLDDMFVYPLAFLTDTFGDVTAASVVGRLVEPNIEWLGRTISADVADAYVGSIRFGEIVATIRSSFSSNCSRLPWGFVSIRGTNASLEIEKVNDREYRLYITLNDGEARVEECDVFDEMEAEKYGSAECHVLTDIGELFAAVTQRRDVQGATAENAARVAAGISLIKASASRNGVLVTSE